MKLYGKEIYNDKNASTASTLETERIAHESATETPLTRIYVESESVVVLNQSTTQEVFTFSPINGSTVTEATVKISTAFTFLPLITTSTKTTQISHGTEMTDDVTTTTSPLKGTTDVVEIDTATRLSQVEVSTTTQTSHESETEIVDDMKIKTSTTVESTAKLDVDEENLTTRFSPGTSSSPVTNFFSDNPKNVLSPSTEKIETTSELLPFNSNEVEEDENDKVNHYKKSFTEKPINENEQSIDKIENVLVTEAADDRVEFVVTLQTITTTISNSASISVDGNVTLISSAKPSTVEIHPEPTQTIDEAISTESSAEESKSSSESSQNELSTNDYELLHDRNESIVSNATRKPRLRNFFHYYFITAIKANESRARELNRTLEEEEAKQQSFLGPGDQESCVEHQNSSVFLR